MADLRKNLQVNQPGIMGNEPNDNNGWPVPLTDPSNPLKMAVTHGSSGSQKNFDPVSTSAQGKLSLSEGAGAKGVSSVTQGSHANKLETSQQNDKEHSTPESERSQ